VICVAGILRRAILFLFRRCIDKKYTPFDRHCTVANFIFDEGNENLHGYETPWGFKIRSKTRARR
jgi:hypothetical protein